MLTKIKQGVKHLKQCSNQSSKCHSLKKKTRRKYKCSDKTILSFETSLARY